MHRPSQGKQLQFYLHSEMLYRKLDVLWPSDYMRLYIILKLLKLMPKYAHIEFIAYSVCL